MFSLPDSIDLLIFLKYKNSVKKQKIEEKKSSLHPLGGLMFPQYNWTKTEKKKNES